VRRLLASLVLAVISFTLAPLSLFASADDDLPACCRKDGKHKCAMSDMAMADDDAGGPTLRSASRCPMFPVHPPSGIASVFALAPDQTTELSAVLFPACAEQAEALYRISFNRSRQKRGPPSSLQSL